MIKKARQIDDPFSWMRNERLSLHNFNADVHSRPPDGMLKERLE